MRFIADRIVKYANGNNIIHINDVPDIAIKNLLLEHIVAESTRKYLKNIDSTLDIYIPNEKGDSPENMLMRRVQSKHGRNIDLSTLRIIDTSMYNEITEYGSPSIVLSRWGFNYYYSSKTSKKDITEMLKQYTEKDGRTIKRLHKKSMAAYLVVVKAARKEGISVADFIGSLGYSYFIGKKGRKKETDTC